MSIDFDFLSFFGFILTQIFVPVYVFRMNAAMTEYHRKNLPDIYGAVWLPRRQVKNNYVDWQATSQLLFLTASQELMCLIGDDDDTVLGASASYFNEQSHHALANTPFSQLMAKQQQQRQINQLTSGATSGLLNKSSTKEVSGRCMGFYWRERGVEPGSVVYLRIN